MKLRSTGVLLVLMAAVLTASSLAVPAAAGPDVRSGTLLHTSKAEKQAQKEQRKQDALEEKARKKGAVEPNPIVALAFVGTTCDLHATWTGFLGNKTYYWTIVDNETGTLSSGSTTTTPAGTAGFDIPPIGADFFIARMIVYWDSARVNAVVQSDLAGCIF